MGNCVCQAASRHGGAEPWGDGGSEPASSWAERAERAETGEERAGVKATVAVRISKRRLQELMAEAAGGMTVEEVLAEIVSAGEVVVGGCRRRRWEPALHSIPEAVESS
jgi:hypothetical protein